MSIEAIVACAGSGKRLRRKSIKPLVNVGGVPIFVRTVRALSRAGLIDKIILVVKKERLARFAAIARRYHLRKIKTIVIGGKTRTQSIRNGLKVLDSKTRLVVIHDGVRPFIEPRLIRRVIKVAAKWGAAVLAIPVRSTVQKIDPLRLRIAGILDRKQIWEIQTPQAFKKDTLLKAYKNFKGIASDDATLVKKIGGIVKVVPGSYHNIKITTPEDLRLAELLLRSRLDR